MPPTSSRGTNKRKRSNKTTTTRSNNTTTATTTTPPSSSATSPPVVVVPPPPSALVDLLRSDSKVLAYFQSLQSSLESDVRQWKDRATRYRDKAKQLQVQLEKGGDGGGGGGGDVSKTQDNHSSTTIKRKLSAPRTVKKKKNVKGSTQKSPTIEDDDNKAKQKNQEESSAEEHPHPHPHDAAPVAFRKERKHPPAKGAEVVHGENDAEEEQQDNGTLSMIHEQNEPKIIPIDDSIFDCLSSGDDDSDNNSSEDDDDSDKIPQDGRTTQTYSSDRESTLDESSSLRLSRQLQDMNERVPYIVEAYEALQRLGVQVVHMVVEDDPQTIQDDAAADTVSRAIIKPHNGGDREVDGGQESSSSSSSSTSEDETSFLPKDLPKKDTTTESPPPQQRVIIRRPNQDVIADIMNALRTLTRLPYRLKSGKLAYPPFLRLTNSNSAVPCCYPLVEHGLSSSSEEEEPLPHPAVNGCKAMIRALSIMDVYCDDNISEDVWNTGLEGMTTSECENNNSKEDIRIGMRNRTKLVQMTMDSLRGEISDAWAYTDRSLRLVSKAQHFQPLPSSAAGGGGEDGISLETDSKTTNNDFGSKSHPRLISLAERCIHSQVVSTFYLQRSDPFEVVKLIWNYVLAAAPSLNCENYPRLHPALSLCVLEALLRKGGGYIGKDNSDLSRESSWCSDILQQCCASANRNYLLSLKALSVALRTSAAIWNDRLASDDDRITDISQVELSSYARLKHSEAIWFQTGNTFKTMDERKRRASDLVEESYDQICSRYGFNVGHVEMKENDCSDSHKSGTTSEYVDAVLAFELALVMLGDIEVVKKKFRQTISYLKAGLLTASTKSGGSTACLSAVLISCCSALRQLRIRQIDSFRLRHGTLEENLSTLELLPMANEWTDLLLKRSNRLNGNLLVSLGKCCAHLADGESMYKILEIVTSATKEIDSAEGTDGNEISRAIVELADFGFTPTVRVINLKRRQDRMNTFMAQAQQERILVVKALAKIDQSDKSVNGTTSFDTDLSWGGHAFDGKGGAAEVQTKLASQVGGGDLYDMVDTHWRPNDLKAFDKNAKEDDALVSTSPSERACALSHIASWKSVINSTFDVSGIAGSLRYMYRDSTSLLGQFRSCGFAQGLPLLQDNDRMAPTPAFVVLEDDAILADRFSDRLESILEELPRDFHFCSIGYSRPKTAPIVKYSSNLGIPSCIWYLTGYMISAEGAKYLMKCLPVRGPVDSWIGLKMCDNWDNTWGYNLGVGMHSRPSADTPRRKDLATILKFRAFCALTPLCSQKVDVSTAGSTGRSWRQRDTDITYSGNS